MSSTDSVSQSERGKHPAEPVIDGLRAWQAAVVRLWSATEDAFAELTLSWSPKEARLPWSARLWCGDGGKPGWSEDVQISGAASIQQALQRLWDRAQVRHGLFKDDPSPTIKLPTDFPADLWLAIGERALLDQVVHAIQRTQAIGLRLGYYPGRRLRERWWTAVHKIEAELPEGLVREASGESLLVALDALLHALSEPQAQPLEKPKEQALMEQTKPETGLMATPPATSESTKPDDSTK